MPAHIIDQVDINKVVVTKDQVALAQAGDRCGDIIGLKRLIDAVVLGEIKGEAVKIRLAIR